MKKILFFTIMAFSCSSGFGQTQAITESGDTVLLFENGTWRKLVSAVRPSEILGNVKATVEVDEFTNTKKVKTEMWDRFGLDHNNKYISGYISAVDRFLYFNIIYTGDLGCFSQHSSTLTIKLADGEIIECTQVSDTDCGDYSVVMFFPIKKDQVNDPNYLDFMEENVKKIESFDWVTIRLTGSQYYTDITPNVTKKVSNPEQFFRQHLSSVQSK